MSVSDIAKIFRTLSDDLALIASDMENYPNMNKDTLLRKCAEGKAVIELANVLIAKGFAPIDQQILSDLTIEAVKLLYEQSKSV